MPTVTLVYDECWLFGKASLRNAPNLPADFTSVTIVLEVGSAPQIDPGIASPYLMNRLPDPQAFAVEKALGKVLARPVRVSGVALRGAVGTRNEGNETLAKRPNALRATTDSGHLMALSFGGPHVTPNQVAQAPDFNRTEAWRQMERILEQMATLYGDWNLDLVNLVPAIHVPAQYARFVHYQVECVYPETPTRISWAQPALYNVQARLLKPDGTFATQGVTTDPAITGNSNLLAARQRFATAFKKLRSALSSGNNQQVPQQLQAADDPASVGWTLVP